MSQSPQDPQGPFPWPISCHCITSKFQNLFPENSPSNKTGLAGCCAPGRSHSELPGSAQSFSFIAHCPPEPCPFPGVRWRCLRSREVHTSSLQTLHCLGKLSLSFPKYITRDTRPHSLGMPAQRVIPTVPRVTKLLLTSPCHVLAHHCCPGCQFKACGWLYHP